MQMNFIQYCSDESYPVLLFLVYLQLLAKVSTDPFFIHRQKNGNLIAQETKKRPKLFINLPTEVDYFPNVRYNKYTGYSKLHKSLAKENANIVQIWTRSTHTSSR